MEKKMNVRVNHPRQERCVAQVHAFGAFRAIHGRTGGDNLTVLNKDFSGRGNTARFNIEKSRGMKDNRARLRTKPKHRKQNEKGVSHGFARDGSTSVENRYMEACEPKMAVEIRAAQRSEIGSILALLSQDSLSDPPEDGVAVAAHFAAFDAIAADPNNQLAVAMLDGEVGGTLQLSFIPGLAFAGAWLAQLEGVRVRKDLRNLQIGTRLIQWAIARAEERGCRVIQLTSNRSRVDAQRFYARLGFQASHTGMKLKLGPAQM
jgi:GNAT superfamily N-acetyltransferase